MFVNWKNKVEKQERKNSRFAGPVNLKWSRASLEISNAVFEKDDRL